MNTKTYDSKCHDLAEHFAQDEHLTTDELHELACTIQEAVEDWFSMRENAAEAAYDRAMEEPTFRGGESAAYDSERMAEIQRTLK